MRVPWLPAGTTAVLPDRGEVFYRHHRHPSSTAPTLLLLHGWTADADSQFFTAYPTLAAHHSFVALDHRGHGRGLRCEFSLEAAADDAAELVRQLGLGPVILVGYSMGGPISMLFAHRHPELVAGIVVQATALEWRESRLDRAQWWALGLLGFGLRSRWFPSLVRGALRRLDRRSDALADLVPWLEGEMRRNDPHSLLEAGRALAVFDAREWASSLRIPAAQLVTTQDQLVKVRKQRALAAALRSTVRELDADHYCTLTHPAAYAAVTLELVGEIARQIGETSPTGDEPRAPAPAPASA